MDSIAHYPKYYPQQFLHFMKTFGQDKVIYASSYPLTIMTRRMKELDSFSLDENVRSKFLKGNALRLLKL
jgi:predicted TIM-barrel fold metal-dependent hydrolase